MNYSTKVVERIDKLGAEMEQNLNSELSGAAKTALAALLGFTYTEESAAGFRNRLRDLPAFGRNFTIGDALNRYLESYKK